MNNRVTSDSGNTVSLFPFLAVLLCTMGALLVLLIVLGQRAAEHVLAAAEQETVATPSIEQPPTEDAEALAQLVAQRDELRARSQQLEDLREQADKRLREEQDKLAHLEEHTRRLEHEIARLIVADEQLIATEQDQSVDQVQAERELERLTRLIAEKETLIEELREEAKGKRTFAIIPFLGKDGTAVPRIYIECCAEGVIVKPEGTRFTKVDFLDTAWAGNPLAQVVRATQQHLRAKAQRAGDPNPPEALPLMIVRPDGIEALEVARDALEGAEIHYGFDYVGGDQTLTYPVALDPALADTQHQALMIARQHLSMKINSAPRRYKAKLESLAVSAGAVGMGASAVKAAVLRQLASDGSSPSAGLGSGEGGGDGQDGSWAHGGIGSDSAGQRYAGYGDEGGSTPAGGYNFAGGDSADGGTDPNGQAIAAAGADGAGGGTSSSADGQSNGQASSAQSGLSMSAGNNAEAARPGAQQNNYNLSSEFNSSGRSSSGEPSQAPENITKRTRNAVPIQRPIPVIVRKDHIALLPNRQESNHPSASGVTISLNQSPKQIGAELSVAIRDHVKDWGIAGSGLYWKPVLSLKVGPDGWESAQRLKKMLSGSGLGVKLPENARLSRGGKANAPR